MYKDIIGIVGGMGSYATIDFFRRLVDAFPGEKEWDRPRIIIDNRCTMPSRVKAIIYEEERPELLKQLSESIKLLLDTGATFIVLACNTSHIFIKELYESVPEAKGRIVNIIECLLNSIIGDSRYDGETLYLLATEGTIQSGIFPKVFSKYGLTIVSPKKSEYKILRNFIESVKQNLVGIDVIKSFETYVSSISYKNIIIGCTELPIISMQSNIESFGYRLYDPIDSAISYIVNNIR